MKSIYLSNFTKNIIKLFVIPITTILIIYWWLPYTTTNQAIHFGIVMEFICIIWAICTTSEN